MPVGRETYAGKCRGWFQNVYFLITGQNIWRKQAHPVHFDGKFVRISVYKIRRAVYNKTQDKTQEKTAPLSRSREFGKAFGTVSEEGELGSNYPPLAFRLPACLVR
ncbi:hypothetical protein [Butyricicoccus porcorum]|uniref:hypothetical protein n=1 Tax=Butyricicoccus porcorum TaxID=1945634 RepID=UPI003F4A8C59